MLKQEQVVAVAQVVAQPPSGGCVLKQGIGFEKQYSTQQPPSGGCVLKLQLSVWRVRSPPAAFGRLCVETDRLQSNSNLLCSRLRAAVC